MRKPLSVWVTQALIALAGVVLVYGFVRYEIAAWPQVVRIGVSNPALLAVLVAETAAKLLVLCLLVWTLVMIFRRSQTGRWLGLVCLLLLLGLGSYSAFSPSGSALPLDNAAQRGGAFLGQIIVVILYVVLMVRFGFSRAARGYFSSPTPRA